MVFQDTTEPFCKGVPYALTKCFTMRQSAFEVLMQAEESGGIQFL